MFALEWLFVIALVLYTLVIWRHRFKKKISAWMVMVFGLGLAADSAGTVFLCAMMAARWQFTLHTISGLVSLLIMALHFLWTILALKKGGAFESYFNRWSIYAWLCWLVAFVSGVPLAKFF